MTEAERCSMARAESAQKEAAVLRLVGMGAGNAEIGRELKMAERTVKKYCSRLFRKYGISELSPYCKRARLATMAAADRGCSATGAELNPREKMIAKWVRSGKTNAEIGAALGKNRSWVVRWLREIYDKTGMGNRTELALWSLAKLGQEG